ncbi:hypothetical protein Leryth_001879 [Lithospermum erythrorhizon]|nr:hypothetical protein Leryth_001879 [Lithospermum erythrorhizon]
MEGGGGGGPAPFLIKTYEMVDDSATDDIVSWTPNRNSFVVWNPPEFARLLLPTYFKHNNFSSFIRQLNTYGFRKSDPERWEFANDDFVKDQKHMLKNIHRRKPIHSHSNPQGSTMDPERAAFEDEIDKLSREKSALEGQVLQFRQKSSGKFQLEELTRRIGSIEKRQDDLLTYFERAVQCPEFVDRLTQKLESLDFSAFNKKRRLPHVEPSQPDPQNAAEDNDMSSKSEFGSYFHQDFSNKLRLELSSSVSEMNLVSQSTQSSNIDGGTPQRKISERWPNDMNIRPGGIAYDPQTFELSDTGASFTLNMDPSQSCKSGCIESPMQHSLQQNWTSDDEGDCPLSCQLDLTLASSPLQVNKSPQSARTAQIHQESGKYTEVNGNVTESTVPLNSKNVSGDEATMPSMHDMPTNKQGPASVQARVNDVFWEQFLTERPGSDTEEASSNLRSQYSIDQAGAKPGNNVSENSVEQTSLFSTTI